MIVKKSPQEIEKMAAAGAVLAATMDLIERNVRPGVLTEELDRVAERFIRSHRGSPSFKGYRGFPGSICASPGALVVHGIPGRYRLVAGDIISIDIGVTLDGWVADAARTFAVGDIDQGARQLLGNTEEALHAGVARACPGNRVGDISHAIQGVAEGAGLGVIRQLVGHGVGRDMHEDPQVPNYGPPGKGPMLEEGMVLAIEPMTSAGRPEVRVASDGWAIFTQDGSPAAHFEFTVAITPAGPLILTPWHLPAASRTAPARQVAEAWGERSAEGPAEGPAEPEGPAEETRPAGSQALSRG